MGFLSEILHHLALLMKTIKVIIRLVKSRMALKMHRWESESEDMQQR